MANKRLCYRIELPKEVADCGALNWRSLAKVRQILLSEANKAGTSALLVDMQHVKIPSAALMGILVATHKRLHARGARLELCNIPSVTRTVIRVCGLDRLFYVA